MSRPEFPCRFEGRGDERKTRDGFSETHLHRKRKGSASSFEDEWLKRLTHIIGQNGAFGLLRLSLNFALRNKMEPRHLPRERARFLLPEGRKFPTRTRYFSFAFEQKR